MRFRRKYRSSFRGRRGAGFRRGGGRRSMRLRIGRRM